MDRLAGDHASRCTAAHPSAVHDEGENDLHHHGARKGFEIAMSQEGLESRGSFGDDDHRRVFNMKGENPMNSSWVGPAFIAIPIQTPSPKKRNFKTSALPERSSYSPSRKAPHPDSNDELTLVGEHSTTIVSALALLRLAQWIEKRPEQGGAECSSPKSPPALYGADRDSESADTAVGQALANSAGTVQAGDSSCCSENDRQSLESSLIRSRSSKRGGE